MIVRVRRIIGSIAAAAGLLNTCPAAAQSTTFERRSAIIDIAALVQDAARRFGIPETWIYAVMRTESAGRIDATSPAGAMGLMQIMPATWATLTARYSLGGNAYDPRANIMAGAAYLREMYARYGSPGFLAAYNAGPGRYEQYTRGQRGLPLETRNYVAKIAPMIGGSDAAPAPATYAAQSDSAQLVPAPPRPIWTQASLFVVRSNSDDAASDMQPDGTPHTPRDVPSAPLNGLFAPVSGRSIP